MCFGRIRKLSIEKILDTTMVVTYFMTRSLQNIYLLLLVRLLVSATIYFCIMKLLKVQILEECIAFCKRGR